MKRKVLDIGIYGTGIFNYVDSCEFCEQMKDVDINGHCEECFKIEMKGGNKK